MSELEIKPCPFCGGEAKLRQYPYCDIIRCENDGCEVKPSCGMGHDNADCSKTNELIEAWNTRATRKPTDAVREFAEHVAEDTRRRESKAWAEAATQTMDAALRVVDDCDRRIAELEKAVIALYVCATDGDCDDCPLNDAHPVKGFRLLCDGIGQLLDGLGIEVD